MPIAEPEVTATLRSDVLSPGLTPEKLLFVGQKLGGTAVSGALVTNVSDDPAVIDGLVGPKSPIGLSMKRGRLVNKVTRFDFISLDDNGGAGFAAGNFTIVGTASEAGTIDFFAGSKKINKYTVPVTSGDTATVVGDALETLINADPEAVVVAVNTTGVVVVTAESGGTVGNTIGLKIEKTIAGLTLTAAAMTGGATDPVLTGVLDVVGLERYQGIVWQFQDDLDIVDDFLEARFNVANNVLDGRSFVSITDTFANLLTAGNAENSGSLCINGDILIDEVTHRGPNILEIPFVKMGEFAAIRALRRTGGAVLGDFVIARSPKDTTGGIHMNSKPYFNTPFFNCEVPDIGASFTETEVKSLLAAGIWVIDGNRALNTVIAGEVVTTFKTDSASNPDPTKGFLNFVDTQTAAREFIVNRTRARYPQHRAASGALIPDVDSANEASVTAFVTGLNGELGDEAIVNVGVGSVNGEPVDFDKLFRENLSVTLDPVTGKFSIAEKAFIVTQARAFVYDIAVAFVI